MLATIKEWWLINDSANFVNILCYLKSNQIITFKVAISRTASVRIFVIVVSS